MNQDNPSDVVRVPARHVGSSNGDKAKPDLQADATSGITTVKWVYLIISLFVALFLILVLFFQFQMDASVAIRAYVGGEGLWAKAQKDAVHSLGRYFVSRDEADYLAYRREIQVPLGGYMARIELQKENPDMAIARAGLLQGRNHPVDIEYIIPFFRRFQHNAYMSEVIGHWTAGDRMIAELNRVAEALHEEIASGRNNPKAIQTYLVRLDDIDRQVAVEEDLFSSTLAEASRWANEVSRNLTYAIVLLFVALGVGLSQPIITRIRRTETALRTAQEELRRKEKLAVLGQIAGSVGHELRNPLGVMSNAVFYLQSVLTDADDTTKEYLHIIKEEITGSERIVSDLLDSVRTKQPHTEAVGVRELIEQMLRKLTLPDVVTVDLDIPESIRPLQVDGMQILQVLRNLISNGIEAMLPTGGVLKIRAVENKPDGTITVSVQDSGIGMSPEQMGNLFQPLFTTKARGIGLGLVVVKNLTEANGGRVEVQSEIGKGTTFTIILPT